MTDLQNDPPSRKGVWLPIEQADKRKTYDLCVSDGKGYRWRETSCVWKRGGRYGKAGWYFVSEYGVAPHWSPIQAVDFFRATHFMEVQELPA